MPPFLVVAVIALFPISELLLARWKHARGPGTQPEDRGSMRWIWLSIAVGVGLAVAAQWVPAARLRLPASIVQPVALALLVGGLALRWAAILTLGRLFTVDVAVHEDHVVVDRGPYHYVRHPSYTGLLIAFVGLSLFFANWLSLVGLLVPVTLAILNRVAHEERVLTERLGPEYSAYCARTKRFVPGLL